MVLAAATLWWMSPTASGAQSMDPVERSVLAGEAAEREAGDSLAPPPLRLKVLPGEFTNTKRQGPDPDLSGLRRWDAFGGMAPISERSFYTILGRRDLVDMAEKARTRRRVALGAGVASMMLGTLLFTSQPPADRPAISPRHLIGGFLIPVGGLTIGFSMIVWDRRTVPLGIARELAEEYNLRTENPAHAGIR